MSSMRAHASKRTLEAISSSEGPSESAPKKVCSVQLKTDLPKQPGNPHENDVQTSIEPAVEPTIISLLDTSDSEEDVILHTDASATTAPAWTCNKCTLINDFARIVCDVCSAPAGGRSPEPIPNTSRSQLFAELLTLQNCHGIVGTVVAIECPVCLDEVPAFKGAVLSSCLHSFCRECLVQTVLHSEHSDVQCPFTSAEYSCGSRLLDSEIRGLLSDVQYAQYMEGSLREAERSAKNAFHCKTPDCRGWCFYELGLQPVLQFRCPVCEVLNCISCDANHEGRTCEAYKVSVRNAAEAEVRKVILNKGDVMQCSKCKALITKISGCDWLTCSMCKTEICWVTRGPRWGSGGKGDTTAGCRCGVGGKKCHPECKNCH